MTKGALTATAGVAAVAIGFAWAVSPLAVTSAAVLALVCWRATVDLPDVERRRLRALLAAAIGLRLAVLAAVFATTPAGQQVQTIFGDSRYLIDRSIWLRNLWMNVPLGAHQYQEVFDPYGASSFGTFLALLQVPAGPSPFGLSFLSLAVSVAGALAVFRVVRRGFGTVAAASGLAALLFWPSLFAWSISVLKEPAQLFLGAIVVAGIVAAVEPRSLRARVLWLGAVAGALALLVALRAGSVQIAAAGLVIAVALRLITWSRWMLAVCIVLALAGAWRMRGRILLEIQTSASRHIGHVKSAGVSYRLLDERYYSDSVSAVSSMSPADAASFLAAASVAFVLVPQPWAAGSGGTTALIPEQIAWYAMCVLSIVGFAIGIRRAPWLTCVLAGSALAGLIVIAPNSGNVGTLVRHRGVIVPWVIWLGGLGLVGAAEAVPRSVMAVQESAAIS